MDAHTLQVYQQEAATFATAMRAVEPVPLYTLIRGFFHPAAPTADIGCGSGRDTAWLSAEGYRTTGYDASAAMLAAARQAYPDLDLRETRLPELAEIPDSTYQNVLCAAVLMHLPREDLIGAALNLARILQPGGRLLLSYRASRTGDEREPDGRLFTPIPPGKLALLLESAGLQVVHTTQQADAVQPDVRWQILVAEKSPLLAARGLERIQRVLAQDRKVATYKLALIRGLCAISRTEAQIVHWGAGVVYVPLRSLAVRWLVYYWPFVTAPTFIAQIRGEHLAADKPIKFRRVIAELARQYGQDGLYALLRDIDAAPERFHSTLKVIADTIRDGPITYAGTEGPRLFGFTRQPPATSGKTLAGSFGWVVVPEPVWLDLSRFDHWIKDSIVVASSPIILAIHMPARAWPGGTSYSAGGWRVAALYPYPRRWIIEVRLRAKTHRWLGGVGSRIVDPSLNNSDHSLTIFEILNTALTRRCRRSRIRYENFCSRNLYREKNTI